jgi:hypothetical protein
MKVIFIVSFCFLLLWLFFGLDWEGWEIISPTVLLITAIYIYQQTVATKEMVKLQYSPRVSVGMLGSNPQLSHEGQDEAWMGTKFVFHNYTEAPIWVWRKLEVAIDGKKINKADANRLLGNDLLGKNPLPVRGNSIESGTGFLETASYDFLLNIVREKNIDDIRKRKITATLAYWSAYNNKRQKDPLVFGPVPYYFNIERGGWIIGGGLGMPFSRKP